MSLTFNPFESDHAIFTTVVEKFKVRDQSLVSGGSEQEEL